MGLQFIGHNQSILGIQNYSFLNLCVNTNNLRYASLKSEKFKVLTICTNLKRPLTYNLL